MKRKDLIHLIKSKAQDVQVKDLSEQIVKRANDLPQKEVTLKPNMRFRPRLIFSASLATLLIITLAVVFLLQETPEEIQQPQFEDVENVLMFSSVSTTSLLENSNESELSANTQNLNIFNLPIIRPVDDKIDDLKKYFDVMEQLFASNNDFNYERQNPSASFGQSIRFKTKDFLDDEISYEMDYNQTSSEDPDIFDITGQIKVDTHMYYFTGQGSENDQNRLDVRTNKDTQNYVDLTHEIIDDIDYFHLMTTTDGVITDNVTIKIEVINQSKRVEITINHDADIPTYRFVKDIQENSPVLKVDYIIATHSGQLIIRPSRGNQSNSYNILVKPDNGIPYSIIRLRISFGRSNKN